MSTWKEITKEEFEGKVKTSAEYEAEIELLKKNHTIENSIVLACYNNSNSPSLLVK